MKSWKTLYDFYYSALCSYANSIIKDSETAKDLVQDILIKIWDSNGHFKEVKDLLGFFTGQYITIHCIIYVLYKFAKKAFRQIAAEEQLEFDDEQFAFTVQEELIRQLYVYIDDLPKDRREIILLSLKGYSGNEIAETLGITINTVKKQKNRGFKYLREKLQDSVWLFLL